MSDVVSENVEILPTAMLDTVTSHTSGLPSWYLVAGSGNAISAQAQRFMAKRAGSRTIEIGRFSPVVMLSHPNAATSLVQAVYAETRCQRVCQTNTNGSGS